jgi:hypothetical protein
MLRLIARLLKRMIGLSDGNSVPWRDFCSKVENMKPTARLHKILAKD